MPEMLPPDRFIPRSSLRYRPIDPSGTYDPQTEPYQPQASPPKGKSQPFSDMSTSPRTQSHTFTSPTRSSGVSSQGPTQSNKAAQKKSQPFSNTGTSKRTQSQGLADTNRSTDNIVQTLAHTNASSKTKSQALEESGKLVEKRSRPLSNTNTSLKTKSQELSYNNVPLKSKLRQRASRGRILPIATEQQIERLQPYWLVFVGIGMLITLLLVFLSQQILPWAETTWNDLHYGRPRTYQMDIFVGHEAANIPSHFIALNLHGQVQVIELPGGDPTHAHIFVGPQLAGNNADLVPVTLRFVDTHKDHHPDMIVLFQNTQLIFHNEGGTFKTD